MAPRVVHLLDHGLQLARGMVFPLCKVVEVHGHYTVKAGSERHTTTRHYAEVTCTDCRRMVRLRYPGPYEEQ